MDDAADRLYALPLEEFTAQRDATARELRRAGDREAAGALAKLPKPTPAAWAANQLARSEPELIRELLDAGEALREAQFGGSGEDLREATAAERRAVDAALKAAAKLKPAGRPLSRPMADRLRATLHAAAADEDIRAALAAGRLASEAEAGGAWPLGGAPAAAPRPAPRRAERTAPRGDADRAAAEKRRAAEREGAARAAEERKALEAELRAARAELRKREHSLASAERASERAQKWLDDAQRDADAAEQAAADARDALQAARDDVARLEERLD
jgi:hypothetical protein